LYVQFLYIQIQLIRQKDRAESLEKELVVERTWKQCSVSKGQGTSFIEKMEIGRAVFRLESIVFHPCVVYQALKSESPADIYRLFEQILWEGMMGI